jgi:hypothetical protein
MANEQQSGAAPKPDPRTTTIVTRAAKGAPLTWAEHDANHVNAAATADNALTNAATAQTTATNAQITAAAAAPGGKLITYTGTGRPLAATDNGNVLRCSSTVAVAMTVPTGLPAGFTCMLVQGGAGVVSVAASAGVTLTPAPALITSGIESDIVVVPAGTNAYTAYSPVSPGGSSTLAGLTDIHTYDLPNQNTPLNAALAALGSSGSDVNFIPATLSGTRGVGNTLTAQMLNAAWGWDPLFQWQQKISGVWTNIAGATSVTYVEVAGNAANDIRCLVQPVHYISNVLTAPSGAGFFVPFVETWQTQGNGNPVNPARWTVISGTPKEWAAGGNGYFDPNGAAMIVTNGGGYNGVIEFPIADNSNAGGVPGALLYSNIFFRSNAAGTIYSYLQVDGADHLFHYHEFDGTTDANVHIGTIPFASGITPRNGVRLTLNGANVLVELDTGAGYVTDMTITAVQNLTAQYIGLGCGNGSDVPAHGPIHVSA